MDIKEAFGKAVKIRRVELGMTQEKLADRADMSRTFMSAVEHGEKAASITKVWAIAQALDCKPSDLWLDAERRLATPPSKSARH